MEPLNAPAVGPASADASVNFAGSSLSRQARRLYVGGIPFGMTDVSATSSQVLWAAEANKRQALTILR